MDASLLTFYGNKEKLKLIHLNNTKLSLIGQNMSFLWKWTVIPPPGERKHDKNF